MARETFADEFCRVFCDRASLRTEDLLDATLRVLYDIMAHPSYRHGFARRFRAVEEAAEAATLAADDVAYSAYEYAYEDAFELLDDICNRHGCAVVVDPDDPTVMLIVRQSELSEWEF